MKLYVEFEKCCGFGECVALAPDLFRLGDDNRAVYTGTDNGFDLADATTADLARDAAFACPAEAIRIEA
ncbi:ferredoxin [Frankia sp. AgB1.9]|uniref:ferredoxin n=1 Tax=unclassified Frankia TaxID=2632575 RepID=UPI001933E847|nr:MULTISPECIES: ferredoxin [unclassified Frankia]MBL7493510.1 ferredoxin [Frankia sp. AgW1.1]MBL7552749.1 ferredoxin [Frankia sp. AgB1.9]MBL7624656.1 ferredoxin [Frankia sp. AgB1.8]